MKFLIGAGDPTVPALPASSFAPVDGKLLYEATEAWVQIRVSAALTWSRLGVYMSYSSSTVTTVRSRANGANGNQVVTIPSGTTGDFEDTTHSDSLASGDLVAISIACAGAVGAIPLLRSLMDDGGANSTFVAMYRGFSYGTAGTRHTYIFGDGAYSFNTDALAQWKSPGAATYSDLRLYVSANTRNGAYTWTFRKNGASGNQVVTIPSSTTGEFEDTTNSDSVVATDLVNYRTVLAGTTGSVTVRIVHMTLAASERMIGSSYVDMSSLGRFIYYGNVVGAQYADLSETDHPLNVPEAFTAEDPVVTVYSNSLNGVMSVVLRKDGADTTLTVSIPAATTGIFVATGSVQIGAGAAVNWKFDGSAATAGSMEPRLFSFQYAEAAAPTAGWGYARQLIEELLMG